MKTKSKPQLKKTKALAVIPKVTATKVTRKEPFGRPTIYSQDILDRAKLYVEDCVDNRERVVLMVNEEKGYTKYETRAIVNLPTIEELSYILKISKETIYAWCITHKDFSDVINDLRSKQGMMLIKKGLSGEYNPIIAKLILVKHGYRDVVDTDVTTKGKALTDVQSLNDDQLRKIVDEGRARSRD